MQLTGCVKMYLSLNRASALGFLGTAGCRIMGDGQSPRTGLLPKGTFSFCEKSNVLMSRLHVFFSLLLSCSRFLSIFRVFLHTNHISAVFVVVETALETARC